MPGPKESAAWYDIEVSGCTPCRAIDFDEFLNSDYTDVMSYCTDDERWDEMSATLVKNAKERWAAIYKTGQTSYGSLRLRWREGRINRLWQDLDRSGGVDAIKRCGTMPVAKLNVLIKMAHASRKLRAQKTAAPALEDGWFENQKTFQFKPFCTRIRLSWRLFSYSH